MMKNLISVFTSDLGAVLTGIVAILAFAISLYNLIRYILEHRARLRFNVTQLSKRMNGIQLTLWEFANESHDDLIIHNIKMKSSKSSFVCNRQPSVYKTKTSKRNGQTIFEEWKTLGFPFKIPALDVKCGVIRFDLGKDMIIEPGKIRVQIQTNRKSFRKTVFIESYRENFDL